MLYSAMATKSLERKIDTLTAIIRLGSTAEMRTGVWFAVARGTPNPIGSTQFRWEVSPTRSWLCGFASRGPSSRKF
jgi:hypothetical protein